MIHFPPRLNYSLSALKEVSEYKHDILVNVLEQIAAEQFGLYGDALEVHKKYTDYMMSTGLICPVFSEDDDSITVYFRAWSFFQGKYVDFKELESFEKEYTDAIFTEIFSVN